MVGNWNREPRTVRVRIDLPKLGMNSGEVRVTRALKHPLRQPNDPSVTQPMPDKPLTLRGSNLSLWLAPRNLEVILLESTRKGKSAVEAGSRTKGNPAG